VPLAERNLYLASVGFIWLVARALSLLNKRAGVAVTGAVLVAYSVLTIVRLPDWKDDLPLFKKALEVDPSNHGVRVALAAELGRRKQYDDGLVLLDEVIRAEPNNSTALVSRAALLTSKQEWGAVIETCEGLLKLDPKNARCHFYKGIALNSLGQGRAASESLDRAIAANPVLWQALFYQGNIALASGNFQLAVTKFEQVVQITPMAQALTNLGTAYAEMGMRSKAAEAFRAALQVEPQQETARRNLEILLSEPPPR
jgi:tetratricopeptide (TPR) repeat protein